MIARLLTLVTCASLSLPTLAQWSTGYSTAPSYLLTFDSQPSNAALDASQGRFTWVPEVSGRQGTAYFDRTAKNYIDLKNFPDNLNRPIPNIGGEMSVEVMILQRDFAFWQRQWAFANTTVDSRGLPNSNPTGEYICMANSGTDTLYRLVTTEGTTETVVAAPGTSGRTGEWNHVVATFAIRDANAPTNQRAMTSLYVNGQLIINGTAYLPRTGPRTLNFLGRTEYMLNTDAFFMGYYDTFAVYTHPLSQEAAWAHAQTSRPPVFELTFSKNPTTLQGATTTPTYSWAEGSDLTRGLLVLSGSSQSVNLLTSTGTASVGTSMPTSINGASTGQPRSAGWSYTATVSLNALTANAAIFDARDAGNNRVRMYINAAGNVIFAMGNGVSITSSNTLQTGRFYHISAVVSSTGSATLYVDSQSVGTGTGSALAAFTVTQAFLGQSTDTTPVFLNGRIDSFRVYDIALSADEVAGLAGTISVAPTGNLVAPRPAPAAKQSAPISSYSFNSPPPPLGQAGLTNFSWVPSLLGRQGMAFLDGTKGLVALKDYPNDQGGFIPTLFGGSMSFEVDFQYLSSANQAMVYSFAGPRSAVDNNLHLMNTYWQAGAGNINTLRSETYTQRDYAGNTQLDCLGCTNGSWAHGIVSIQQWNLSDSTSSRSALITMYINGQLVAQKYGTLPPVLHRPNLNLGQSGWASDALFYGNLDDFHFYNYGLSQEAASVHFTLPAPPAFEAVFAEDVRVGVATPSFSWQFNETATGDNIHQGMLMLSGGNQFANLSASSGANFIGFTFPPMIGNGRNTPGVATEQANGWSVNVVFKATSTASGVTIYDIANADGSNSLKLAFGNANQVVFSHGSATLSCGAVAADEWTSIIIVVAQDGTNMDGQCYKNGARVASSSTFPAVPYVSRNSVLLGRANTGTNTNFNGVIDAFHFLPYTVSSEDAAELQRVYSSLKRVVDAPAFFSGPTVSHTFDVPPALDFSDPTTAPTYNFWTWSEYGPPYAANAPNRRRGVAVFDRPGGSRDLRQYIDLTFDQDAYGMVMPQQWGGSMSFEFWVNMASLRDWSRIFDCASNLGQDNWNSAAGEFSYNLLLSVRGDGATPRGLLFQHYAATGGGQPQYNVDVASPNGWNPGTWQYIVATVEQTSATNATMRVYVDGVLRGSTISPPPPVRQRQFCWIGRSNWNDNALNGTIDIFNYYNYALSQDQITRNMRLPNPPYFDASFETTPARGASPTYGWVAQVQGATGHTGALTFNGVNQYVDLFSGSSASSIGQVFPTINGISVGIDQAGFSFEMSCLWSNVNGISRVFDLGNGNGVDSFAIGNVGNKAVLYVNNGLIDAESVIGLTQITVNTFYHFVIVGRPVGGANSTVMNYQVYVAGRLANTFNNRVAPARLSRRVSYLARSTIPSDQYFQGSVDLLRYYTYAVNADTASYLSTLAGPSAEYVPTGDIVFSSTGGGNPNPSGTTQTPGSSSSGVPAPTSVPAPGDGGDDGINGAASFSAVVALIASLAVALML